MAFEYLFTAAQYRKKLLHIIYDLPTSYSNQVDKNTKVKVYYNCGYRGMNAYIWDCWNWHKTLAWGWTEGYNVGSFLFAPNKNGVGDWNGKQIYDVCSDKSTDFKKIADVEMLLTKAEDHMGVYIGKEIWNGYEFNVAECSPRVIRNGQQVMSAGCHLSYVDDQGRRFNHKGGVQVGSWYYHGKLPWIDYREEKTARVEKSGTKTIITIEG